jgi:tight adherence protein B
MIDILIFMCILLPVTYLLVTGKTQQEVVQKRQFLALRIGNKVSLIEHQKIKVQSSIGVLIKTLAAKLENIKLFHKLVQDIEFSGHSKNPEHAIITKLVLPMLIGAVIAALGFYLIGAIGFIVAFVNYLKINLKVKKKLGQSLEQLPDLISLIASSLRAGNSLFSCFAFASEEMAEPTKGYFKQLHSELQYGVSFRQASTKMLKPLSSIPEYCMFISAITIQRESGGNLSEVLEILSTTVRERLKIKGKVSALTGQSRLTGYLIGAIPAALLLFLSIFNYSFVEPLFTKPLGKIILAVSFVMQVTGFFVIKKIVDIRV